MTRTKLGAWAVGALMMMPLASCGKEPENKVAADAAGPAQIASLDDYDVPVDKSAEITAIDAATGDASGMPRDGGGVVSVPKAEPRRTEDSAAPAAPAAGPIAPPAPAAPAAPAAAVTEALPQ